MRLSQSVKQILNFWMILVCTIFLISCNATGTTPSASGNFMISGAADQINKLQGSQLSNLQIPLVNYTTVAYNGSMFVTVGYSGTILTSPDGTTWNAVITNSTDVTFHGVSYGNGKFVAVGSDGAIVTST